MALLDFTSNHKNELMVGSEDYEIRVFEDDELLMGKVVYIFSIQTVLMFLCPSKDSYRRIFLYFLKKFFFNRMRSDVQQNC